MRRFARSNSQIIIPMSTVSTRFTTVARGAGPARISSSSEILGQRLSTLYALSQRSSHVFGSPLGPLSVHGETHHLPRFVYFGPCTSDDAVRLAFLAGFDHTDLRSTLALLHLVERLALSPEVGQGLNLSFFPLVDAVGLARSLPDRGLAAASWLDSSEPEIGLLRKDARTRGYHGFVRVETARGLDEVTVRLRGSPAGGTTPTGVELISSEELEPLPVRWEADPLAAGPTDGPLTLADDLPVQPFELTLLIPAAWSPELYREAVVSILKRFILRYRAIQAISLHL